MLDVRDDFHLILDAMLEFSTSDLIEFDIGACLESPCPSFLPTSDATALYMYRRSRDNSLHEPHSEGPQGFGKKHAAAYKLFFPNRG